MFPVECLFNLILLHSIVAIPQLNLYFTDGISQNEDEINNTLRHNCLRIATSLTDGYQVREIKIFCMSELPSKFHVMENDRFPKFTFAQLAKENITSEKLYLWSAPIDLIESYQFYLNQLSTLNDSSSGTDIFYNCTLPRFGPMCQYELDYYHPKYLSLGEIIRDTYDARISVSTIFACYTHLKCNRGPYPPCLDWGEICDGKVDCFDNGADEEHCWQLEINKCNDNEYRCMNGQCIPKSFLRDLNFICDCIDSSDRISASGGGIGYICFKAEPSFACDDVRCENSELATYCWDRRKTFQQTMYSIKDESVSSTCWSMLECFFQIISNFETGFCRNLYPNSTSIKTILNDCPYMLYTPNVPVLFGDIYIAFRKNYPTIDDIGSFYICYNDSRYDTFGNMTSKILFNNRTCSIYEIISYPPTWFNIWDKPRSNSLGKLYNELKRYTLLFNYTSTMCNRSNMYQCIHSSKCISIHRINDNIYDCPDRDDENSTVINDTDIIKQMEQSHYKCQASNKYIHQSLIRNVECNCLETGVNGCEDENLQYFNFQKNISFQHICDGFVELIPVDINGRNETDETECQQWECDNIYTRCNTEWNCPNGADEIGCDLAPPLNCSLNHRICVSPTTYQFICLPIKRVNDGKVDCLGGTDESILCPLQSIGSGIELNFYCMNHISESCISDKSLCDGYNDCKYEDDERFCPTNQTFEYGICRLFYFSEPFNVDKFLCTRPDRRKVLYIDFSKIVEQEVKNIEGPRFPRAIFPEISDKHESRCYRGLDLRVWLNNSRNSTKMTCLCPLSYYGDQCQYQNQRISLTLAFRAPSDAWQTQFAIVISLIDNSDQRMIHSYEQLSFLWVKNCATKFNIYLLYATQPKDLTKNYTIHIDFYEKVSLAYRGSALLPITFLFLPVQRLAFIVDIPRINDKKQSCSNDECVHGKCIRYSNNLENATFCHCDHAWSGRHCTIPHVCMCSSDSLCIGSAANNRSICVCPRNRFGLRCLLTDSVCQHNQNSTCYNGGQCVSNVDYLVADQKFICVCPEGVSGDRCEIIDNKLILSFDKDVLLSQSIFIHFIEITRDSRLLRSTTFRTISVKQSSVTIYWSQTFHLVFTELSKEHYYLTVLQKNYDQSIPINKTIHPADRCPHISDLFNQTFFQWPLLRRIKYYHLPCQRQSLNLSCFYDDVHFCLCYTFGEKRLANCFNFDHNMVFNCFGENECENGGQCFQDTLDCPHRSMCMCQPCFYGRRCQYSTSGFGLSLDAIIGYHILPNVGLTQQPSIIKFSLSLTIIFMIAGLINGALCIITFKNKSICEVGCGLYLFGSSINALVIMLMFGLKFSILLLAQMTIISNRSFLQIQCISLDFILRVCLCFDQWLNACVAVERAMTVLKETGFDKKKSKQAAKFVIITLLVIIIGSCIHDPFHRSLIDEGNDSIYNNDDQKRTWCIVTYPFTLQVYNSFMQTFHFCGPFMINVISIIVLIIRKSRQQNNIHKQQSFKKLLQKQFQQHKQLLIAPIVLISLALPRLIITFVSKCMKSVDDAWLFIIGYFISFLPSMLTSVIFIVPSKFYKRELHTTIEQYGINIRRRLHILS